MATLTLHVDENLIKNAEAYSKKLGKSLSEMIADYLADVGREVRNSEPHPKSHEVGFYGSLRGTAEIVGDIVSPLPEEDWEVLRS